MKCCLILCFGALLFIGFGCAPKLQGEVLSPVGGSKVLLGYTTQVKGERLLYDGKGVYGTLVSKDGKYIAVHRLAGNIVIKTSGSWEYELPKGAGVIDFSPDCEVIATTFDKGIQIINLRTRELIREWGCEEKPRCVRFSLNGKLIAITTDELVRVMNVENGQIVFEKEVEEPIAVFSPDSKQLYVIVRKNAERIPIGSEAFSTTLIWSYWLVNVAAGGVSDDEFYLYDLETGKLVA